MYSDAEITSTVYFIIIIIFIYCNWVITRWQWNNPMAVDSDVEFTSSIHYLGRDADFISTVRL